VFMGDYLHYSDKQAVKRFRRAKLLSKYILRITITGNRTNCPPGLFCPHELNIVNNYASWSQGVITCREIMTPAKLV
jgi:hypothetical protein